MNIGSLGSIFLLITSSIVLFGCTPQQSPRGVTETTTESTVSGAVADNGAPLQIVTTFLPLYAHVANLVDENDTVTNLIPPGSSTHFRQPKPSDLVAIEQADIIVINGLGLEEFLEDYLSELEAKGVRIVDTSAGVELLEYEDHEEDDHDEDEDEDEEEEEEEEDEHGHEGVDPHIWLHPANAQVQVRNILAALEEADSTQQQFYNEQATKYIDQLEELDRSIRQRINTQKVPPFIVFHDAYQYFLHAYDLGDAQVGMVQEFHGDSPSQRQLAELIETIEREGVQTIYTEPQFNPSVVQRLEQETGVISKEIDPIGTELTKNSYRTMIENVARGFMQ